MGTPDDVDSLIEGWPFGRVYPDRPNAPLPSEDPRTIALRILARYLAALDFYRPGDRTAAGKQGPPIRYRVPAKHIFIDRPDDVQALPFPSIVFLPGECEYLTIGLNSYIDESTRDKFGQGLALQEQYEFRELVVLECFTDNLPVRRSLMGGIEVALVPTEQMYGIRFRMLDYYDQTVCFTLWGGVRTDDPAMATNRRRWGHLIVEMRFNVSALVRYSEMTVQVTSAAYDEGTVPFGVTVPDGGDGKVTQDEDL